MAKNTDRKRTFTGCITCRQRRAKCDERRPACSSCERRGIKCEGYAPKLVWVTDDREYSEERQSRRGAVYRYPLFSESRRQALALKLARSLGNKTPTKAINELDKWQCPGESDTGDSSLVRGPFSVFVLGQGDSPKDSDSSSDTTPKTSTQFDDSYPEGQILSSSNSDGSLLFGHDMQEILSRPIDGTDFISSLVPLSPFKTTLNFDNADFATLFPPNSPGSFMPITPPALWDYFSSTTSVPSSPSALSRDQISDPHGLLHQMEPLLRHYKERVLEPAADLRKWRRSPWQILFWPCALETYGEIKLWNSAAHPRAAVLYAILANSAFHLHATERSGNKWQDYGLRFQRQAKQLLFQALQDEILGIAHAKYKELLMAILSVAMVSLFERPEAFKGYLLAAEYVIRHRGLYKQNSVKARTLHHMYTHLRILTEGTCTFADCVNEFAGLNHQAVAPVILPKFGMIGDSLNNETSLSGQASGPHDDIHLKAHNQNENLLYASIYGIPESLMSLLSRTVACANEKDKLGLGSPNDPTASITLQKHLQTLELEMWSWDVPPQLLRPQIEGSAAGQDIVDLKLSRAMHQAVIIYFYRRVYDTDAMVLQAQVKKCLDDLEPCIGQKAGDQDFATSIAWATYIAACGAVTPELRQRALRYLDMIDSHGVMLTPKPAVQISRFWQRRLERGHFAMGEQGIALNAAA